ncbi:hypothetical protein ACHHYP_15740 [Achlya hypogyna]|uniref:Nonsense-mediated mRNA decay factor SMG8 n=1 Tax=Achlya hypogyna TaxID=1202772 RepID=A0A1V9YAB2_ACHHY|nr:hypothetical protein ACHHYP_15740 [Achlya hypogyna]
MRPDGALTTPPPPLPPLPLELLRNIELTLHPAPAVAKELTSALLQEGRPAVVVGVTGSNADATTRFANRLLGSYVFADVCTNDLHAPVAPGADVRFYYDHERHLVVILGLLHSPMTPIAAAEIESARLQLLLLTSCHILYMVKDDARVSTSQTKLYRTLVQAKQQLGALLKAQGKHGKVPTSASPYAPGRLVPVLVHVFPLPTELAVRSNKGRAAMMTFCKAMESKVQATIKPLRSHVVSVVRLKDLPSQLAAGRDRRLFIIDPSHTVVAVTRKVATGDCDLLARMASVLDLAGTGATTKQLFQPLEDEDSIGVPHAIQYISKAVDVLLQNSGAAESILPLGLWLRHVQQLVQWIFGDDAIFHAPTSDDYEPKDALTPFEALDTVGTFAHDLCAREYPAAVKRYLAERPEACSSSVHAARVERTLVEFKRCVGRSNAHAANFAAAISAACTDAWSSGRRLCDAISISNQPCTVLVSGRVEPHQHSSGVYLTVACHCGASLHRSNTDTMWQLPCCRAERLVTTASGATLLELGDFAAYQPQDGFTMDGFVPKFTCLSPWYREAPGQPKRPRRQKSKEHPKVPTELVAYAGLEYECTMGHRFFFTTSAASLQDTAWPGCDMAVYVQCFQCAVSSATKAVEHAQLRRVYVATPPGAQRVLGLHLSIKLDESEYVVFAFDHATLPANRTICCCLPYVFTTEAGPLRHGAALKLDSRVLSVMPMLPP